MAGKRPISLERSSFHGLEALAGMRKAGRFWLRQRELSVAEVVDVDVERIGDSIQRSMQSSPWMLVRLPQWPIACRRGKKRFSGHAAILLFATAPPRALDDYAHITGDQGAGPGGRNFRSSVEVQCGAVAHSVTSGGPMKRSAGLPFVGVGGETIRALRRYHGIMTESLSSTSAAMGNNKRNHHDRLRLGSMLARV
jgi:hypothetical protein